MASNSDQRIFWSETVGGIWVNHTHAIDAMFAPVLDRVLAQANVAAGAQILDIGCGAGGSSFAAGALVGDKGRVMGIDISAPLLDAARQDPRKSAHTEFLLADAQTYPFELESFDIALSRFGVMFFDDPLAAFANVARSLRSRGALVFATWGTIAENPFFTLPAALSKAHFGPMPKSDPDAPGPFSMRDTDKVCDFLQGAGLVDVAVTVEQMTLTPEGSTDDLAALMSEIGPAKSALAQYNTVGPARDDFLGKLAQALAVYETPKGLHIPAEINIFTARKA